MANYAPTCAIQDGSGQTLMEGEAKTLGPYVEIEVDCGGMNRPGYPESVHAAVIYRVEDGRKSTHGRRIAVSPRVAANLRV